MSAKPVICPPGGGDVHAIGSVRNYVKITGGEADGRLDVAEIALPPGYVGPPATGTAKSESDQVMAPSDCWGG